MGATSPHYTYRGAIIYMEHKPLSVAIIVSSVLLVTLVAVGGLFLPSWGRIHVAPTQTVTVVGEAKSQEKSQIAVFSAGVNAFNDDKTVAVNDVNRKVEAIIAAVKVFGVTEDDIKTQSLNIYQNQEQYYEDGRQKYRPGQWNVSNTVEITLRNVDQASALAGVLTNTGANNVYGPNFTFDDTSEQATALLDAAFSNAKVKAEKVAQSTGQKLGKVVSVTEAGASQQAVPYYARMEGGGGGGGAVEPGSGTVSKTVTVTFELR
jgi:uncharacterized protein YggE